MPSPETHSDTSNRLRLGVNIDHVATIRNARGGSLPDPLRAAQMAAAAGADGITAHLREDRRHISDDDIVRLSGEIDLPLNLEMAATSEMLEIALRHKPHAVCLVPEKREERTTEGGLDVAGGHNHLAPFVRALSENGSRVSLFIEASSEQMLASASLGAPVVELHVGAYCDALAEGRTQDAAFEFERIEKAVRQGADLGLEVHAGHGITYDTVSAVAALPTLKELNIGHFLIGEAIFVGLEAAILRMRHLMNEARGVGL
ncbi:MAG: pyridoxine 5'-phosphate synthase [Parvibaculaceae bacterium]|nr:pyridoxine 5'-phosphate synthase [Parvibaculaceae bacterium]